MISKQGDAQTAVKNAAGNIVLPEASQDLRHQKTGLNFFVVFLPSQQEIFAVHITAVKLGELFDEPIDFDNIQDS